MKTVWSHVAGSSAVLVAGVEHSDRELAVRIEGLECLDHRLVNHFPALARQQSRLLRR